MTSWLRSSGVARERLEPLRVPATLVTEPPLAGPAADGLTGIAALRP